jgi:hypothetical protein
VTPGRREFTAPDLIRPVIGFRQWRLGDLSLWSLFSEVRWSEPVLVAGCDTGLHEPEDAPRQDCACGIYAWYAPCPRTASMGSDYVAGAVVLWGAIELHATGMRSQHARLVALELPWRRGRKHRRIVETAEAMSVPAVPHSALRPIALQHGAPVPRRMRPSRGVVGVVRPDSVPAAMRLGPADASPRGASSAPPGRVARRAA